MKKKLVLVVFGFVLAAGAGTITVGALRFAVATPNIGTGDLFLGDPNEHFRANDG